MKMIRSRHWPVYVTMCIALTQIGCGKHMSGSASNNNGSNGNGSNSQSATATSKSEVAVDSGQQADNLLGQAYVNCENPARCNPSVGMLAYATSTTVGTCTAWLVSDNMVVTNSHCIPQAMRGSVGSSCQGHLKVLFPRTSDYEATQAQCLEISETSDFGDPSQSEVGQDYAFIKLKSSISRPALSVDRQGFAQGDKVTIAKVDPYEGVVGGNLTSVDCDIVKDSVLMMSPEAASPFVVAAGCDVAQENSGAPILDSQGHVRGMFSTAVTKDLVSVKYTNLISGDMENLSIGTNFSCVPSKFMPGVPSTKAVCGVTKKKWFDGFDGSKAAIVSLGVGLVNGQVPLAQAALRSLIANWVSNNAPAQRVNWDVATITNDQGASVKLIPTCVKPSLDWMKAYRSGFLGRNYEDFVTSFIKNTPSIALKLNLNTRFEPEVTQQQPQLDEYALSLKPREIKAASSSNSSQASMTVVWDNLTSHLSFCSK